MRVMIFFKGSYSIGLVFKKGFDSPLSDDIYKSLVLLVCGWLHGLELPFSKPADQNEQNKVI